MTLELKILSFSIVLGLVQIVLASQAASLQRGYMWTASARDEVGPALTGLAGRLHRALRNFVETFPLVAAAVLTAHGAVALFVGIRCGAISSDMKLSSQAARSIG